MSLLQSEDPEGELWARVQPWVSPQGAQDGVVTLEGVKSRQEGGAIPGGGEGGGWTVALSFPAQPQLGLKGQTDKESFPPLAPEREGFPDRKLTSSNPPPPSSKLSAVLRAGQPQQGQRDEGTDYEVSVLEEGAGPACPNLGGPLDLGWTTGAETCPEARRGGGGGVGKERMRGLTSGGCQREGRRSWEKKEGAEKNLGTLGIQRSFKEAGRAWTIKGDET